MNEIFSYSQLMAETKVRTYKPRRRKEPAQIDMVTVLRKCGRILFSRFMLRGIVFMAGAMLVYNLGTMVPKHEKPADFTLPADSSLETIMLSSLVFDTSSQSLAAESSSIVAYAVQTGDTLDKISKKYKITSEKLALYNNIEDARKLLPGMVLRIPL